MSVVIIIGGNRVKEAVQKLETASMHMDDNELSMAKHLLEQFVIEAERLCTPHCK